MLNTLRRIVQEVSGADDLTQALGIIVFQVKRAISVDVCSIYLFDPASASYVLMATDGLNPEAVGGVRLGRGQGLVSLVAETEEPLNLANAPDHPRFRYFAETGEERYHSFLGVPVIHHRKVMGVLIVQERAQRRFDEEEVAFLLTIAAQLAGAIAHAEASGGIKGLGGERPGAACLIRGLPGAPGVGLGEAVVVYSTADLDSVPDRKAEDVEAEVAAFQAALAGAQADIEEIDERLGAALSSADRALFAAYALMLRSSSLGQKTIERIRAGNWAPGALRDTVREHAKVFDTMDDPYLRLRAEDVRDVGRRVLMRLQSGGHSAREYPQHTILVGDVVSATMLAEVPRERLAGVVAVRGSSSSHGAILARALGIPAVVGADDLPVARVDGSELVVDGYRGRVYVAPSAAVREEYRRLAREEESLAAELEELRELPAVTPDGVHIPLYANTGLVSDVTPSLSRGAEGVGLYRTEFPFMVRTRFPGEEEQREIYRQVLEAFAPRPVTVRTLDIGGDKMLPYFPIVEDNPFLGWRGIRVTLDHPEIFLVQLRAMLRASIGLNNLRLLLPMISTMSEVDEALRLIGRVHRELLAEGEQVKLPEVGIMVEVPAMLYQIDTLAPRVDFLSIGSNDLTQYLLAVDRNNARVAALYDSLHPAVLRALVQVVATAHHHSTPVGVCGEMAGDPAAALLLVGMGIVHLSASVASLPRVKRVIRQFTIAEARAVLDEVLKMEDAQSVRGHVNSVLDAAGLGRLIRAGEDGREA